MSQSQHSRNYDQGIQAVMEYLSQTKNMSILELTGQLMAVICAPRFIHESEWMEILDLNEGYTSAEQEMEVKKTILVFYSILHNEFNKETYRSNTLTELEFSDMPLEKIKNYYLLWGKGYLEIIARVCGGSIRDDHVKAYHLITALTKLIRTLYDNEEQVITHVDFEKAQKYTKAIYDFWVDHRSCYGHGQCVFDVQNEEHPGFFKKWFSWF